MMTDKKSKNEFEHISDIIRTTMEKWLNTAGEPITRIWKLWDEAAGDLIAGNTSPAYLKNKVLIVHVASSVWIQQLQFSKKSIIEKINSAAGTHLVKDIKFKIKA